MSKLDDFISNGRVQRATAPEGMAGAIWGCLIELAEAVKEEIAENAKP